MSLGDIQSTAVEILTSGKKLKDWQQVLMELAVERCLSAHAIQVFEKFHQQVLAGDYDYGVDEFIQKFVGGKDVQDQHASI